MASTQTGTCLMVVALCFVLVLGSLAPCLPELSLYSSSSPSSPSHTVKSTPLPAADIYVTSQVRSRSLLFYEEGTPLEASHRGVLSVEKGEGPVRRYTQDLRETHEEGSTAPLRGYLNPTQTDNISAGALLHQKQHYHTRERDPDRGAEYF